MLVSVSIGSQALSIIITCSRGFMLKLAGNQPVTPQICFMEFRLRRILGRSCMRRLRTQDSSFFCCWLGHQDVEHMSDGPGHSGRREGIRLAIVRPSRAYAMRYGNLRPLEHRWRLLHDIDRRNGSTYSVSSGKYNRIIKCLLLIAFLSVDC